MADMGRLRLLDPAGPIARTPNRLGEADWAGWVQERGLYFLGDKDPRYKDLLALDEPFAYNKGEKKGALVEAQYGKGRWIYVGLGLWRELPAGVDGAYQLLANLVSLSAVLLAALVGMPLGALLALTRFRGREAIIVLLNALMGLPPVVVGLAVYLLLSRSGPLGSWGLLFTPQAMVIAQAQTVEVEGDAVVFAYAPVHKSLRSQLEGRKGWLEQIATQVAGRPIKVLTKDGDPVIAAERAAAAAQQAASTEGRRAAPRRSIEAPQIVKARSSFGSTSTS